uniref:Uncharacterized protein n=1 Tax=Oryza sativa subsp. japonica TaxID=39947 RepID=Q6ZAK0_ORYSJ|nr:hypothetical protein [Oryza sativa Japonica Group]
MTRPGEPANRPDSIQRVLPRTSAIREDESFLSHSAAVVPHEDLNVVVFPKGGYLVTCTSRSLRDMMVAASPFAVEDIDLSVLPWSRRVQAELVKWRFSIRVCFEGIPSHARLHPKEVHFELEEPLSPRSPDSRWDLDGEARQRTSPPKLLAYPVLVHLDQVLNFNPPPTEPTWMQRSLALTFPLSASEGAPPPLGLGCPSCSQLSFPQALLFQVFEEHRWVLRGWSPQGSLLSGEGRSLKVSVWKDPITQATPLQANQYVMEADPMLEELAFAVVQPPLLKTPTRQVSKGKLLKKSPTRLSQAGRKSARLAKKAAARSSPAKQGDLAHELLMKKAGLLPEDGKKTEDAMAKYVKLFKQPLSQEVMDAFSALVAGCAIGDSKKKT